MATVTATENLNPNGDEEIQASYFKTTEQQEAAAAAEEEEPQSTNGQDVGEKRKREEDKPKEPNADPLWKTSLCSYFRRQDGCSHGEACKYAHGEAELRQRPDQSWDPTSERAKKFSRISEDDHHEHILLDARAREDVLSMTDATVGDHQQDPSLNKCLVNLPRKWISDELKKFLNDQGVTYKLCKKKKGMTVGFASFDSADQVKNAIQVLDGKSMGNRHIKVTDVLPRSFEKKTQSTILSTRNTKQNTDDGFGNEDQHVSMSSNESESVELNDDNDPTVKSLASKTRSVRDAVTPLAHMPYVDQLEHKKNSLEKTLKRLTRNARKACPDGVPLPEWILSSRDIGGLPCKLEGILGSPLVNGYRNKCEFSVGYSLQGNPTVGFMLGNFREGVTAVEEPVDCPNVSTIAFKYASIFQEFIRHSSLPIWNRLNNTGFWRQLMVREGRCHSIEIGNVEADVSEVMLMVQIHSGDIDDVLVKGELQKLAQSFAGGAKASDPPLPLTTLVVQDHKGISNAAPADAPLYPLSIPNTDEALVEHDAGIKTRIHDYINNLRFSISPTAFFQVNTLGAEKLYGLAGEWAGLGPDTLLFDVCCGTGTIGLTLAHRVGMVVGIEMNASAVLDAERNAEINGIKNCRFVCGKAEDVMGSIMKEYEIVANKQQQEDMSEKDNEYKNIVAIVDPPRVGLHPIVIKALRTHPGLRRLVYISCNPESLVANAIELCTPSATEKDTTTNTISNWGWRNMSSAGLARRRVKNMPHSEAFKPVKAMAVDLFPHTPHCELVMLLQR